MVVLASPPQWPARTTISFILCLLTWVQLVPCHDALSVPNTGRAAFVVKPRSISSAPTAPATARSSTLLCSTEDNNSSSNIAKSEEEEHDSVGTDGKPGDAGERPNALPPAAASQLPPASSSARDGTSQRLPPALTSSGGDPAASATTTTTTTTFMITNEMKRVLIEELGYRRQEVERLREELAGPIIEKRVARPLEGVPADWTKSEEENGMRAKLEREGRYPLKTPLLGVALVLFGKGLSDALVTLIKVQQGFRGASLTENFGGVPVLAIDLVSVLVGLGLGWWTWNTMKD